MVVELPDVPKVFGQGSWNQHCAECQYFIQFTEQGVLCTMPDGSMSCYENYMKGDAK